MSKGPPEPPLCCHCDTLTVVGEQMPIDTDSFGRLGAHPACVSPLIRDTVAIIVHEKRERLVTMVAAVAREEAERRWAARRQRIRNPRRAGWLAGGAAIRRETVGWESS
jgi:hypothetical protein